MTEYVYSMYRADKFYGTDKQVLANISLSFFHGAKIGVLGPNGSGKSTLLRIMAGQEETSNGEAQLAPGATVGLLEQEPHLDPASDVRGNVEDGVRELRDLLDRFNEISNAFAEPDADFDALLADQAKVQDEIDRRDAWSLDATLDRAMDALRLPEGDRDVTTLSGGERRRVALCRLLLSAPDLLLLDEPTNHLDAESVYWLERFLADYKGAVIAVTHDRYFLDNVAGWILELDRGRGIPFQGNYSSWLEQKQARLAVEEKQESARRRTLARELEWVQMSPSARHAKSKARLSAYEKLLADEDQVKLDRVEIHIPPGPRLGDVVIEANGLTKGFGDRLLFEDLTFSLPPAGIVGVIGPNGAGKTTLFRLITGEEEPDAGALRLGDTVQLAYVDQSRDSLDPKKTVWQEISGGHDNIELGAARSTRASTRAGSISAAATSRSRSASSPAASATASTWRSCCERRQRPPPRRADQRPRRRHAARARGGAARLRRLRRPDHPRSLVPRPRRDSHPRLRGRLPGDVVRGRLGRVRRLGDRDPGRRGARAPPDQVQAARPRVDSVWHRLDPESQLRVLGCLIEKQRTTPEQYPLTLNALRLACNQATNRDPVLELRPLGRLATARRRASARSAGRGSQPAPARAPRSTGSSSVKRSTCCPLRRWSIMAVLMLRGGTDGQRS